MMGIWLGMLLVLNLRAIAPDSALTLYYVAAEQTLLHAQPGEGAYLMLHRREPVHVLDRVGLWWRVRTQDGAEGYVVAHDLSNVWLRVSKRQRRLFVYRGTRLVRSFPVDLGTNPFSDKTRRGSVASPDDWRTPEGVFYVAAKNARSQYYRALVLNYPTADDALRGLREGLISEAEYRAIVEAEANFRMPPMNTALGGWIEIHGDGTGQQVTWTQGCVALRNEDLDAIWPLVVVGTPVLIEP
ncbi:L,D-transpeptidase family protein [Rhodothermus marinus]|uniref:ErfK/YbiS/YcfS/YnhG family protein n=1 Tax=Rhodothermus marinus (strain ATCC 43812 / DSM 4252 / R-10) TaxID=518766 RepID=D0ME69_RHOM4|nr:L,D-transpeptidase family protein [Rhodothermus marinus]ACY47293.1 ErfK/YbiS/YcfS/YnhG family protein [Rhodothermus marinus DSM 4252]